MKCLESASGNTLFTCPDCKSVFQVIASLDNSEMEIVLVLKKNGDIVGKRTYPIIIDN